MRSKMGSFAHAEDAEQERTEDWPEDQREVRRMTDLSWVFGFLGLFSCGIGSLVGIGYAVRALRIVRRSRHELRGRGLATLGLIGSSVVSVFGLLFLARGVLDYVEKSESARLRSCQLNLKQLSLSAQMYCTDFEGWWPKSENWCDALLPYIRPETLLHCPSRWERVGYAFNRRLGSAKEATSSQEDAIVSLFDALGEWNLSGGPELADFRHKRGLNVAFADGHVKWMRSLDSVRWRPEVEPARSGQEGRRKAQGDDH